MTTIKLKNGSGAPTAGDLVQGEPALDLTNKRLYTEDSGGTVIEVGTNPGTDVTFADDRKAIFGAGSDLQIYHSGSSGHSLITETGSGDLFIAADNLRITDAAAGEYYARAFKDGAFSIYYNNVEKLSTTSTGIDVTGVVEATGYLAVEGTSGNTGVGTDRWIGGDGTAGTWFYNVPTGSNHYFAVNNTNKLAINSTGIDVTGTAEADGLKVEADAPVVEISSTTLSDLATLKFTTSGSAVDSKITHHANTGIMTIDSGRNATWGGKIDFVTDTDTRMRIDSSGNVKVKTGDLQIGESQANSGSGRYVDIYNQGTDSATFSILRLIRQQAASTSLTTSEFYARKNGETTLWNFETSSSAYLRAGIGTTEGWRIHSSGNVLLGKSSPAFGTAGVELNNAGAPGKVWITRSGGEPLALNRLSSDGEILGFYKDSTTVGRLDAYIGYLKVYGGTGSAGSGLWFGSGAMYPVGATNVVTDNVMDIGHSSYRFQDIYASNGTIQTSDRNEKQDIEELSEAEQRVAVACKGLLRKFRWKSSVEEKGDDARIHFGIIAQDLQDAFTAEGLDAGRYGMFINSTWTDEETGEERSRMGVRYSELLAFIISAI